MEKSILDWLNNGADLTDGARLYLELSTNEPFKRLVKSMPEDVKLSLFDALVRLGGITDIALIESKRRFYNERPKLRQEWLFLNDRDCPAELKILATDKITLWREYLDCRDKITQCTTAEELYTVADRAVEAFIENDLIRQEFDFYSQNKRILGKHPIFEARKKLAELKSLGPVMLTELRKKIEHNIWRIKDNIAKGNRPDLRTAREQSLRMKELELAEINKLIEAYV